MFFRMPIHPTRLLAAGILALSLPRGVHAQSAGRDSAHAVELRTLDVTAPRRVLEVRGAFRQVKDSTLLATGTPTTAEGGWLSISAHGFVAVPSPCYRLAGAADRQGQVVTLNIEARPNGDLCPPQAAAFTYSVRLPDLAPGTYTFRVLHTYRDRVLPATLELDTTMTVRRTRRTDFGTAP
ncbi:MAG TPA: hypothetical protein VJT67_03800 [Longimicrobiaceae bacterium]|nr:hypothetical protein [Longimicrobiaceae bacterium]